MINLEAAHMPQICQDMLLMGHPKRAIWRPGLLPDHATVLGFFLKRMRQGALRAFW